MAAPKTPSWKKPKMVGWYDPMQLAKTGMRTLLSTLLGSMIDTRRFGPLEGTDEQCIVDYTQKSEIWFDFMADTGDGWNGTYTMAYLVSSPSIKLTCGKELPRADFLILGGDQVYPVASKQEYAERLVWPFNEAARNLGQYELAEHLRDIYCVPGNHDWYDSLAAFTRRFCSGRTLGSFRTRQVRSYFLIKLPHDWQIWAGDVQLGHDMDVHQLRFFKQFGKKLNRSSRVILCLAEPDWVYGQQAAETLHFNVERLERAVEGSGGKVRVEIAGDIHNYQHYRGTRDPDPDAARPTAMPRKYQAYEQSKLVSGGGGAFLHPTHTFSSDGQSGGVQPPGKFSSVNRYPTAALSKRLALGNLVFAFKNWKMSGLLGLVYLAMFWNVPRQGNLLTYPLLHPGSFLLILVLFGGLYMLADCSGLKKVAWGSLHAVAHVCLAVLVWYWLPLPFPQSWLAHPLLGIYLPRVWTLLVGALLGGTLFGLYLLVSVNVFRIHENEAFSAIRVENYKHFLRCHLTAEGLTIYVIGVDRVASDEETHPVPAHLVETILVH